MEPVNLPCAAPLGVGLAQAPLKCGEKCMERRDKNAGRETVMHGTERIHSTSKMYLC